MKITGKIFQAGISISCLLSLVVNAETATNSCKLHWRADRYCQAEHLQGKNIFTVNVPSEKTAFGQYCFRAAIDLTPFQNGEFLLRIKVRANDVSQPADLTKGIKIQLYYQNSRGKKFWPGAVIPAGSFEWRKFDFSTIIPRDVKKGELRLGLEGCSGQVDFDLSSLQILNDEAIEEEEAAIEEPVLSNVQSKECALLEERIRNQLLEKKMLFRDVERWLSLQQPDGSFQDIDYRDDNHSAWRSAEHLRRTRELARILAAGDMPEHAFRRNSMAIRQAVSFWTVNRPQSGNWWFNALMVPRTMAEILLLTPELFPAGILRRDALRVCRQTKFHPRYTGNNRVFAAENIFLRALLERKYHLMTQATNVIQEEIRFAPAMRKNDWLFGGIRTDGSYHQHGPQIQFGNYGGEFFSKIAHWAELWRDTRWALTPQQWRIMHTLAFDGFRWVLWQGKLDLLACGRQLGRNATADKGKKILEAFRKLRNADPGSFTQYNDVLKPVAGNTLVGNRHFWNSDYMVHRRPEWYAAVRMNSVRVRPIEDDTNWDNALGRYFSDGVCLVMRSGKEYDNILPCWDWTRLPGTTLPKTPIYSAAESRARGLRCGGGQIPRWTLSRQWRQLGETEFVGGVTDGVRGAAVFTMNLDGVKAKKAYFFDTDAIYQLGADISSTSPHEVATTVNSCIRNGEIRQQREWFHHDGIGYRGKGLILSTGKRTGDWRILEGGLSSPRMETRDVFHLQINHGIKPQEASYCFAILPGATPEETANWRKGKVLSNTGAIQAIEFNDGTIGAIFHEPGKLGNFQTSAPGAFLIKGNSVIAVDPTARLQKMNLMLDGISKSIGLPTGEKGGTGVTVKF